MGSRTVLKELYIYVEILGSIIYLLRCFNLTAIWKGFYRHDVFLLGFILSEIILIAKQWVSKVDTDQLKTKRKLELQIFFSLSLQLDQVPTNKHIRSSQKI